MRVAALQRVIALLSVVAVVLAAATPATAVCPLKDNPAHESCPHCAPAKAEAMCCSRTLPAPTSPPANSCRCCGNSKVPAVRSATDTARDNQDAQHPANRGLLAATVAPADVFTAAPEARLVSSSPPLRVLLCVWRN